MRVGSRRRDGLAELGFLDNGCGMEPEVLRQVFEPFFTRRRERARDRPGAVDHLPHRRRPWRRDRAHSDGPGTRLEFRVRLPLAADATRRAAIIDTEPHKRLKLLFADDESRSRS